MTTQNTHNPSLEDTEYQSETALELNKLTSEPEQTPGFETPNFSESEPVVRSPADALEPELSEQSELEPELSLESNLSAAEAEEYMEAAESAIPVDVPFPDVEPEPVPESDAAQTQEENVQEPAAPVKKPRRRKKTETAVVPSAEDTLPNAAEDVKTPEKPKEPDEEQVMSDTKAVKKRIALKKRKQAVLSIDAQRSVETETDKANNDLLDLFESQKSGRILTGKIQGVERTSLKQSSSSAVIYHGAFKVIIPAVEAVDLPDDLRGHTLNDVYHYLLTKRLGAEVDYVVKGLDPDSGIAIASRLEAMQVKRKQYYFGLDRDGNNLLYPGLCAEARVVSVIRAGIFVDLFGVETYIPLRELSYQRLLDAAGYFQPGQRILVKILELDRSDCSHVRVTASVKQAAENPYEKALRQYTVGNRYVGTVSMVDTNGVFVALDGGIDCLCSYPKRGRPPRGARVTVRILGINHETNRIWGAITHIAMPR